MHSIFNLYCPTIADVYTNNSDEYNYKCEHEYEYEYKYEYEYYMATNKVVEFMMIAGYRPFLFIQAPPM